LLNQHHIRIEAVFVELLPEECTIKRKECKRSQYEQKMKEGSKHYKIENRNKIVIILLMLSISLHTHQLEGEGCIRTNPPFHLIQPIQTQPKLVTTQPNKRNWILYQIKEIVPLNWVGFKSTCIEFLTRPEHNKTYELLT